MALYIKKLYSKDPHFADTKVVYSIYEEGFNKDWDSRFSEKLKFDGFDDEIVTQLKDDTSYENITRVIAKYADGINVGSEKISSELRKIFDDATCLKLDFVPEEQQTKALSEFFDKNSLVIIENKHLECLICQDIIDTNNQRIISCCRAGNFDSGHIYCESCLKQWLKEDCRTCPTCRNKLF